VDSGNFSDKYWFKFHEYRLFLAAHKLSADNNKLAILQVNVH